jgi:hypothetical protein
MEKKTASEMLVLFICDLFNSVASGSVYRPVSSFDMVIDVCETEVLVARV